MGDDDPQVPDPGGSPLDPRLDRFRALAGALRYALGAVAVLALAALLLPDPVGSWSAALAVGLVVAVPLVRVAWFARRWWARGDRRFALVALGVLAVVAAGALLAVR